MLRGFTKVLFLFIAAVMAAIGFLFGVLVTLDHGAGSFVVFPDVFMDDEDETYIYSYELGADALYEDAYASLEYTERVDAASAVVPHHLLVAQETAALFSSIGNEKTDTVILLSPNHFDLGYSPLQASTGAWDGPFGRLSADDRLVERLANRVEVLAIEEDTFSYEHGISAVAPFIAKSFPNAKVVPIIVHDSVSDTDVQDLASVLVQLAPNAVVIASVDMSHALPTAAQQFHDDVTSRTLEGNSMGTFSELDLETDTNAALKLLYAINNLRGDEVWHETSRTASLGDGAVTDWQENTSHILGYYTKGRIEPKSFATLHFVGDIMLDRGVRVKLNAFGVDYPWEYMSRFLRGTHQVVGNLEGTVNEQVSTYTYDPPFRFVFSPESVEVMGEYVDVVSLANNHTSDVGSAGQQETKDRLDGMGIDWFGSYATPVPRFDQDINGIPVTYIGYHQFQPALTKLEEEIATADAEGRFVIVMPHWGNEYIAAPQVNQQALAQIMVEAGADLIIGGHPHVAQGIEVIDDVIVVYSLGNFIFDQQIPATWPALTAGVIIDSNEVTVHLLPVTTRDGQPIPMGDTEAKELFSQLAPLSSPRIQTSVENGVITQTYEK